MPRVSSTPTRAPKGTPRLTLVKGGRGKSVRPVAAKSTVNAIATVLAVLRRRNLVDGAL